MIVSTLTKSILVAWLLLFISVVSADIVKPTLVDISVDQTGKIDIEIRTSIEALLSGINSQYKNTKDAPSSEEYDVLRKMQGSDLLIVFNQFEKKFLSKIRLQDDANNQIKLSIVKVKIPEPGYKKVPRASIIILTGNVDISARSLVWYYPEAFSNNIVKLRQVDTLIEKYHWSTPQLLRNDQSSDALSLTEVITKQKSYDVIIDYIVWGFEHIIPKGFDHILFILGLYLFSTAFKPLLWQVTMFTVAHTITLGLAMNGVISLPAHIVEPLIALSIVYIGIENIFVKNLRSSRLVLVFIFGLLHGLGFASMLSEIGLPDHAFVIALISFNVGVELGQLSIIVITYLLVTKWLIEWRGKAWYQKLIVIPASIIISCIALYWFFERLDFSAF